MDNDMDEGDEERNEELLSSSRMIRVPQIREIDGRYVSSQQIHEEAIKRHLTVIVSRNTAIACKIPFVCHTMHEYVRSNPYDKSANPTPFSSLLDEEELQTYYNTVADREEMVERDSLPLETQKKYDELNRLDREVWHNHINEKEYRKRVARENKLILKEKALVSGRIEKTEIQDMTSNEIYHHLSHHIRNHDKVLLEISHFLSQLNQPIKEATDRFIKMVLCGSTGLGKTELINLIARLCGIHLGSEYEKCHIAIDFATCLEKGHANIITGPGPGYIGCEEPCLVDKLFDAVDVIIQKEAELAMNEDENHVSKRRKRAKIIMLEINEMDKGTLNIFTALNSFFDKGCVSSHRGRRFILPPDVFLVMCACSNFASDYFKSLPTNDNSMHNHREAENRIVEAMTKKGLQDWDIVRLGTLIPFFPINKHDATEIMRFKLREFIAQQGLFVDHINMGMSMSDDSQECFIDHIMNNLYTQANGIRQIVYRMKKELAYNLTTQSEFLEKHLDASVPVPLAKRPVLIFKSLIYEDLVKAKTTVTMATLMKDSHLKVRDKSHALNERRLEDSLRMKCDIAFFVLDCEAIKKKDSLGIHVLSPMSKSPIFSPSPLKRKIVDDDEEDEMIDEVKKKTVKRKKKETESEEDEQMMVEKEPLITFEEETTMDNDSEKKRQGRPRKVIEGFTFYDVRHTRPRYRCDNSDCHMIIEARRTGNHQCREKK